MAWSWTRLSFFGKLFFWKILQFCSSIHRGIDVESILWLKALTIFFPIWFYPKIRFEFLLSTMSLMLTWHTCLRSTFSRVIQNWRHSGRLFTMNQVGIEKCCSSCFLYLLQTDSQTFHSHTLSQKIFHPFFQTFILTMGPIIWR